MSEDIRSKERFNRINDISETNKDDLDLKKIRDNLEKFVQDVLREENITPYELSRRTNTHETLWKNVVDGRTQKPDTGAIVALADYKNVPLDQVIGRDINKEKKVTVEIKQKMPAFMTKFPKSDFETINVLMDKIKEFKHKPPLEVIEETQKTQGKKSFVQKVKEERTRPPNKSQER